MKPRRTWFEGNDAGGFFGILILLSDLAGPVPSISSGSHSLCPSDHPTGQEIPSKARRRGREKAIPRTLAVGYKLKRATQVAGNFSAHHWLVRDILPLSLLYLILLLKWYCSRCTLLPASCAPRAPYRYFIKYPTQSAIVTGNHDRQDD
jgi:hypothetical protein